MNFLRYKDYIINIFRDIWNFVLRNFSWLITSKEEKKNSPDILVEAVIEAKEEWLWAVKSFNEVSEKDLIDYAVFKMNAAQERYIYLLKLCQKQGVKNFHIKIN